MVDAILGLQIIAGIELSLIIDMDSDVNADGKVGLIEVIYILQKIADLR